MYSKELIITLTSERMKSYAKVCFCEIPESFEENFEVCQNFL